jgi:hypothetical protein
MDPNTALTELREQVRATLDNADASTSEWLLSICESFDALDEWMSKGGFLPAPWADAQRNAR